MNKSAFFRLKNRSAIQRELNIHNVASMFYGDAVTRSRNHAVNFVRCYATKRRIRDYCVNGMSNDGRFRVALLDNTDSVNEVCSRWNINEPNQLATMGNVMSSATVLSSFLKGEERIRIDMTKSNIHCCAEAIQVGEVRGYLETLPSAASYNSFSVQKILYDHATPVTSTICCADEQDVNEIMDRFFSVSEQIPTVVQLTTIPHYDPKLYSLFSYAIIVQELPSKNYDIGVRELHNDKIRYQLEEIREQVKQLNVEMETLAACDHENTRAKLHELLFSKFAVAGLVEQVKPIIVLDKSTVRFTSIDFLCRCSIQQLLLAFSNSFSEKEMKEIEESKEVMEATCEYCNKVYKVNYEMINDYKQQEHNEKDMI
jgi:redox-regulated HSP33 family molecular chaperone